MAAKRKAVRIKPGDFQISPTESEKLLDGQLYQSMKTSVNATFHTRLIVANRAVMSKMAYLITLWGGAPVYLLKSLQVQPITAARTVCLAITCQE